MSCTSRLPFFALAALLILAPLPAYAGAAAKTDHVSARLIADATSVEPGSVLTIGLNKQIIPRWHTYWKNAGDSGLATSIAWTLPAGASAGEIVWPAPRIIRVGPVANYGYEDEVTLLTEIRVPENLRAGDSFPIKATVDWLVCEEICIPEQVTLDFALPVVAKGTSAQISRREIEAARAQIPQTAPWPVSASFVDGNYRLTATDGNFTQENAAGVSFFASEWGVIEHAAPQKAAINGGALTLDIKPYDKKARNRLQGVLIVSANGANARPQAFEIDTPVSGVPASATSPVPAAMPIPEIGFFTALVFALLGGIILNLMPCVFPVLSIKVLSLLNHSRMSARERQAQGWAYASGVLACFGVFAGIALLFKAGGAQLGWGFQFQSPVFVLLLAYLLFAVGLSQSGVLAFGSSFTRLGAIGGNDGYAGSFLTGALAAIVATPCTAPFMGAALGFAVSQPAPLLIAIFLALGLGLALPYLALCYWPALLRFLPKPGAWMERLKQALAFPMYAVAVWLVWVLAQQAGPNAVAAALGGMVLIAFAAWVFSTGAESRRRVSRAITSSIAAIAVAGALTLGIGFANESNMPAQAAGNADAHYEPFAPQRLDALRAEGRPVFVNLTAAWCITCLVNERVALDRADVTAAFKAANVAYLKGDWTHRDPAITAMLKQFNRTGVPLYVFYPAGADAAPVVLPQILTTDIVLREIGKSKTAYAPN